MIEQSIQLIEGVKYKQSEKIEKALVELSKFNIENAINTIKTNKEKIIFWTNIYNALFQLKAKQNSTLFTTKRGNFFTAKQIDIFGLKLSFDDIENNILRRSKWKYGLGYLGKMFKKKWEKKLRVTKVDYRIHFLLNCGAESCPIIHPLTPTNFEQELDQAINGYLQNEIKIIENDKKIELNQLFLFYIGDFGGKKGLKKILINYQIIKKEHSKFSWKFTSFDKTLKLNNFG